MAFNKRALMAFMPCILIVTAGGVGAWADHGTRITKTKTNNKRAEKGKEMDKCTGQAETAHVGCQPFSAIDLMKEGSANAQLKSKEVNVSSEKQSDAGKAVGDAWLDEKGNLMLQMRRTSDGIPVNSLEKLAPGTKDYDEVWKHIGGVKPGEKKLVLPWPETM